MISNQPSPTFSFKLRLAVTVLISFGSLCMLIAISTNRWVRGNGKNDVAYLGLWKVCSLTLCVAHNEIIYSKVLFVFATLFGIFTNIMAILGLVYDVTDIKKSLAKMMFLTGLLALCGVIPATVFFVIIFYYESVAYGLILSWLSTVLYLVAGFLSWYHHKQEPDRDITFAELKRLGSTRNPQPPPYTVEPPPSTIAVS